ncbi:hypothetical protein [Streptomyces sp. NBC_00557]|uniref:hypothetical protein n=1 Tax=Streptomyces sp. NBC_00557 TaxID=2975776 RepID=UPI002E80F5E8|nr:hypothetical protein [Streptomyces sp. NBC_00557]WUC39651.1 hypothetical protein OG956_38485 [Streptomyces sp. NBC_00557]
MTDFEPDWVGAEEMRAALISEVRSSGAVDDDIVEALSLPSVPDWLLSHPFQVIADLEELNGSGAAAEVPEKWRAGLPSHIEADEHEKLQLLYERVLTFGTQDEQRALIDRDYLVDRWGELARVLHPAVVSVWERRFPALRR